MKTIVCVSVLLTVLFQLTSTVTVTEGEFRFTLDSVKVLGTIIPADHVSEQEAEENAVAACSNPELPAEFGPLCLRKDAGASLARLGAPPPPERGAVQSDGLAILIPFHRAAVASHADACEICESVACTGC